MAEILTSKPKAGNRKVSRLSTRVDFTPMVDLGFLLITFFIFTTTMSESKAMSLVMPDEKGTSVPNKHPERLTLTFVVDAVVYVYHGQFNSRMAKVSDRQVRETIMRRKSELELVSHDGKNLLVLIKPTSRSTYKQLVSLLNEMIINDIGKYMVVEPTEAELLTVSN